MLHSVAPSDVENPPRESVIFQAGQLISACSSIEEVAQCLLNIVVEEFSPLIARVVYQDGTNLRIAAYRDNRISDDEANRLENDVFVPLAEAVTTESSPRPLMKNLDGKEAGFVACHGPIVNLQNGEPWATVAIIVGNSRDAHETLARLDTLTSYASTLLARTNALAPCLTPDDIAATSLAPQVGKFRSAREFGFALTNSLCNQFQCEQVIVGIVDRQRIQVLAISGCAQLKSGSPGVSDARQSMEECLDHGGVIVFPASTGGTTFPIHRQWSVGSGGSRVCSIPLYENDDLVAVVSFRRQESRPFTDDDLQELTSTIQPFGGLLSLIDRANQPLSRHMATSLTKFVSRKHSRIRSLIAAVILIELTWMWLGTVTYRPLCDSTVVSAELRHMTAPFEARLGAIHVKAGDEVQAGDVLVEFETHQMRLDLETIRAEVARTEVDVRTAIEASDISGAALRKAHVGVLMARKLALDRRIKSAQLKAPTDGMIVQSNFDRRLGQVFAQGEPVLQFAPNVGWMLEVQVPEHIASLVKPDQVGWFVSTACPNEKVEFCIGQVNGSAEMIDNKNVFLARAQLQHNPEWMRSGMQGIARIKTVKKTIWWISFHNIIDWTRLRFWL